MIERMSGIEDVREQIDAVDRKIMQLLASRLGYVSAIAVLKQQAGLEPLQPGRFDAMMEARQQWAEELGVPPELVDEIWHAIHKHSVASQSARV